MTDSITGSCSCGQYVYTIPRPTEMNCCHCLDCRKWAGAFHSAHLFVKTKDIKSDSPEAKSYVMKADSGNDIERGFCDQCGCGLWIKPATKPDMTCLKAGLFDPKNIPNPTMENWLANMHPWETPMKGTKRQADGQ